MRAGEVGRGLVIFLLSLAMVLSIVFVIVGVQMTNAGGSYPPDNIHLTWNEDNTAHTIVVTWETVTATSGDNVKYDTQSRGGNPANYSYSASGSHHTYSGASENIHDVELTGLSPNTVYYFICGGDNGGWSAERSFRTAPDNATAFRFVAGGDSRSGSTWPGPRNDVSRAMAQFNPAFVLFSGDFVNQGSYQWEWDNWFAAAQMYWVDSNNLTIPIIPCEGNHETYGDSGVSYFGQFSLPGNEQYYSLDWGPNLHITVLDTETDVSGSGPQHDWLQNDLATHENYLWKVVLFHEPCFSNGPDALNTSVRNYWVPLFDNYHVDLVITGHEHLYERTYPINYTVSQNTPMPSPQEGTVYVTSGGWGAPLYTGGTSWYTAVGPISEYHFVVIDIDNRTLQLKAVDTNGTVFDTYTINKIGPKVSISPSSQVRIHGSTLSYAVTVTNIGIENDNYVLTVTDNENWAPTLVDNRFENVAPGGNRPTTLSVTIPENAAYGTVDSITITATSVENENLRDNASCVARSATISCKLSIDPGYSANMPGENTTFTVWVKNTSDDPVFRDNYTLVASDNSGWGLLIDNIENVLAGDNGKATLTVAIPENASYGAEDLITVTATSRTENMVSDNSSCMAYALSWMGTATFKLENMYNVSLEKALQLYTRSKLVVKFYDYSTTFESEVIIESITPPQSVVENENVSHPPQGSTPVMKAVKKANLVLTTGNTDNIISTIASFTVHQSNLRGRITAILKAWGANPGLQSAFRAELTDILKQWGSAPP